MSWLLKIKRYAYLIALIAFIGLLVANCIGWSKASLYKDREAAQRANVGVLMQDVERYKVDDSLNAVRVHGLSLTIDDLKRYRAEDASLIKKLSAKIKDVGSVSSMTTQTVTRIKTQIKDSIRYLPGDTVYKVDTLKCLHVSDKWYTLDGCINSKGGFDGLLKTYDQIKVIETVKYKRFLFWRTHKVKSRKIDAISLNPNTVITDVEFISIIR